MDFCDLHGIKPDYQLVELSKINVTWDDVVAKKARYRYVIDMKKA